VGDGFGIPFILRYVLEFCDTVNQAVAALSRIPSHMAYNVTVLDKTGRHKTLLLSPEDKPIITSDPFTTNHQQKVDWVAYAKFNKTVERSRFLENLLKNEDIDNQSLSDSFLKKPLYNNLFTKGFGTLYTADYRPVSGSLQLRWLDSSIVVSFNEFIEQNVLIQYFDPTVDNTHDIHSKELKADIKSRRPKNNIGWLILTEYSKKKKVNVKRFNYNKK
jgi:predicted choloylglycine hydrolase